MILIPYRLLPPSKVSALHTRDRVIEGAGQTQEYEVSPNPKLTHSLHNYSLAQIFLKLPGFYQIQDLPSLTQPDHTPANFHPDPSQLP